MQLKAGLIIAQFTPLDRLWVPINTDKQLATTISQSPRLDPQDLTQQIFIIISSKPQLTRFQVQQRIFSLKNSLFRGKYLEFRRSQWKNVC